MRRVLLAAAAAFATGLLASAALAQAPTEAERSAMRAACPADFEAHCAGIAPGTLAALQCLQKNEAKLSPACASAVKAVGK